MLQELREGVWWLRLGPFAPFRQNAFLVDDGGTLTLVDAGMPWDAGTIRDHVGAAGYELDDLERVLITHYDLDHVGGLRGLARATDLAVYMGGRDLRLARGEHTPPLAHHKGAFHRALRRLFTLPDDATFRGLADDEAIGGFTAYHTPGHNPGHTVYVHEGLSAGFLGDLVWEDGDGLKTPIRLDSYDMTLLGESVGDLARRVPAFDVAAMGHGTPLRSGGSRALADLAASLE